MTAQKKNKSKGPIRTEAVVPTVLILALLFAYFHFLFDRHLKSGLEWALTHANGAEVNLRSANLSLWNGSLVFRGIEVTDKEEPSRNLFSIDEIRFDYLWDALLRARFVVEKAYVREVIPFSPRRHPGRVLPPPPPSAKGGGIDTSVVTDAALGAAEKRLGDNAFGSLIQILQGAKSEEQLEKLRADLKTEKRLKELEVELKEKERGWQERLASLPKTEELNALVKRAEALKVDTKNPAELVKTVGEAQKIAKEGETTVKNYQKLSADFQRDLEGFQKSLKDVERLVEEDIREIKDRLQIPTLDPAALSQDIFRSLIEKKLGSYRKYWALAEQYMPAPKAAGSTEPKPDPIVPPPRGAGRNHRFPITKGYPRFWLRHAEVSTRSTPENGGASMSGQIRDASTDPQVIGRPLIAELAGDFPAQGLRELKATLNIDRTTAAPKDSFRAEIAAFPSGELSLSDTPDMRLRLTPSHAAARVSAEFVDGQMTAEIWNQFEGVQASVESRISLAQQIVSNVFRELNTAAVTARATGSWYSPRLKITSDIGEKLAAGFRKEVEAQVAAAEKKVRAFVDEKIMSQRKALEAQYQAEVAKVQQTLKAKEAELKKLEADLKARVAALEKQGQSEKNKAVNKAKDNLIKGLKGKLKF